MKNKVQQAGAIFAILIGSYSCKGSHIDARDPTERIDDKTLSLSVEVTRNIKFSRVEMAEFAEQLALTGKVSVTEDRITVVPARVSGRVDSVFLASGEFVRKDQVLASLFSPDFISTREEYLQSMKRAQNTGGRRNSSDFSTLTEMARRKLETMGLNKTDIEALPLEESKKSQSLFIRAPRDGFLLSKTPTVGSLVNVGDTLFTIADLSKVWFTGDLYPEDLSKVHKGQEVTILPVQGGFPIRGVVSFISPVVDPTTRTIKIRALMNNEGQSLRSDMYVQGNVILKKKQALLLPNDAIVRTTHQNVVFKRIATKNFPHEPSRIEVQMVPVQLGSVEQSYTEVTQGIAVGDEIVIDGALLLYAALNTSSQTTGESPHRETQ